MMSLTFDLFTQVSGSGPLGPLVLKIDPSLSKSTRKLKIRVKGLYLKVY